MGDIHGDLVKAITLFKLAGVVEEVDRRLLWIGGDTTVVQLGDVLDRGSQEIGAHRRLIQHESHETIGAASRTFGHAPNAFVHLPAADAQASNCHIGSHILVVIL